MRVGEKGWDGPLDVLNHKRKATKDFPFLLSPHVFVLSLGKQCEEIEDD